MAVDQVGGAKYDILCEHKFNAEFFGQARDWQGIREEQPGLLEQAAGGTIFINGVEKMSLPAQARLLRVIQRRSTTANRRRG